MFKEIEPTENLTAKEHQMLVFWAKNKIFQKLVQKNKNKKRWSFLDGPITANNPMGVHHAWGRTYKDIFQRFRAMRGFEERFQNGFDCQGLWVEVEVEKELGFRSKKEIEDYGIEKFVQKCKERVLKYAKIQTDQSIRLGQWMDWKNSYYTMSPENNYAIWHFLKTCFQRGYLYKGKDSVPWCPRCGTAISQHEILTEEYQEITHQAIYFRLPIISLGFENASFLVWTTTPWTLPANVALAINPKLIYGLYQNGDNRLILLKSLAPKILDSSYKLKKEYHGQELLGLRYSGPFDHLDRVKAAAAENPKTFHLVISAKDLVTADEGTGLVHIAPGAGAEDYKLSKVNHLPVIEAIDGAAFYLDGFAEFSGKNAKEKPEIILDYLKNKDHGRYFFKIEDYKHRYPTCWRCKTELVWRAVDEWYISMEKLRQPMIEVAKKIKWLPSFGLERELDWLKNMQDWLISKKRYWGLALPIYECSCGNFEIIGSKEELRQRAVEGWNEFEGHSPHRPWIDKIKIKCSKCDQIISRIPDVGNPWLDAGIVPFSTLKYFEDKDYWQKWYPADFICESFPGQFKNWFYSLIAMSTVLENSPAFRTALGYALLRDEKGEEMHKSKGNAIWFDEAAEKMGVDIMRWLFVSANPYENLNFGYNIGEVIKRRFILIFKNICQFFVTYANLDRWQDDKKSSKNILDRWVKSRLNQIILEVGKNLENFHPQHGAKILEAFIIDDLSTWYLRRSRKRRNSEFYTTLYHLILDVLKLLAPFIPFLTEDLYQSLKSPQEPESVHLNDWPTAGEIDEKLLSQMAKIRKLTEVAHRQRAEAKIKVRQPLDRATIEQEFPLELLKILQEEINVKKIEIDKKQKTAILLDLKISPELKEEGIYREIIRLIQGRRKIAGLQPGQKATLNYSGSREIETIIEKFNQQIAQNTNVELKKFSPDKTDSNFRFVLLGQEIWLKLK